MGRKRVVALLLCAMLVCALCLVALPKTALAAPSSGPMIDLRGTPATTSGDGWVWANNTLTLTGLDYTSTGAIGIYLPAGSTIVLTAGTTNTVRSADSTNNCSGIECAGDLTITGGGALTATSGNATRAGGSSRGIYVLGNLTVTGGSKLTGVGGGGYAGIGVNARSGLTVEDTSEVDGRSAGVSDRNSGIITNIINASGSAKLTGVAGAAVFWSNGIQLSSSSVITGGTILASSGAAQDSMALSKPPNLGGYPSYYWRTAATDSFTLNSVQPFVWASNHTYVEIRPGPGGGGNATGGGTGADVPRTGDSAQPWLWAGLVLLAGAGLMVSAVLRGKRQRQS